MTRNTIGLLDLALEIISIVRDRVVHRTKVMRTAKTTSLASVNKKACRMTRNPVGLLELALEISTAKANGCDQGDCSCGESDDCLAKGWEAFQPAQPKQPAQTAKANGCDRGDCTCGEGDLPFELPPLTATADDDCLGGGDLPFELPLSADDDCLAKGWEAFAQRRRSQLAAQPEQPTKPQKPIL